MVRSLTARSFRNLEALSWRPGPGVQLLFGGTGAGKTSVLEAIYVAATTKSFRTAQLRDCVSLEAPEGGFRVELEAAIPERTRVAVRWTAEGGLERSLDGGASSLSEHVRALPLLSWSSADLETLVGAPEARRRMVDRGLVAERPAQLRLLADLRRALQHKREALAAGAGERQLAAWNELLRPLMATLGGHRSDYVKRLAREVRERAARVPLALPEIGLSYRADCGVDEEAVARRLEAVLGRERELQRVLAGPQRDRIELSWRSERVARVASAGERKSVGLILVAAQAELLEHRFRRPVLLLDDVDVELDRERLRALWPVVTGERQVVASSNRPEVFSELRLDGRWEVLSGRLSSGSNS